MLQERLSKKNTKQKIKAAQAKKEEKINEISSFKH